MQEVIATIKTLPLLISTIVLLFASIGVLKSKTPLQAFHFITIIEIICIPLAILTLILFKGASEIKMILCVITIAILSPVTSYLISKAYRKQTNDTIEKQPTKIF